MSREGRSKLAYMVRRAGWWGTGLTAGAIFFLTGSFISFIEGDMRIAFQALVVTSVLWTISFLVYRRRG
ncbi:MAG: hypothetical protein AB7H80_15535 [Candidatus Kapaibacterium sp.]